MQTHLVLDRTLQCGFLLPGHVTSPHLSDVMSGPSQSLPPNAGVGVSHVRVLVTTPPPHVTAQDDRSPQAPHPPSTGDTFVIAFVALEHFDSKEMIEYQLFIDQDEI